MTAAPATLRARRLVAATAIALAIACGALAVLAAIVWAAPDDAFADAVARGTTMMADRRFSVAFGPETAAAGADGGALGWLAALASAAFAASPLRSGAGAFVASACALGGFALVARRVARVASPRIAIVAMALAFATSIDALHPGFAATTLLFAAALAGAFDLPGSRGIAAVGIVTLVWCQVDAAGVLAPVFALANVAARVLVRSDRATLRLALATFGVASLATLATPEFVRFPAFALDALHLGGGSGDIVAWAPPDVAARAYRGGFSVLLACALGFGLRASGARDAGFAIVAIVLAFANGDLLPLATVFVVPVLAVAAERASRSRFDAAGDVRADPVLASSSSDAVSRGDASSNDRRTETQRGDARSQGAIAGTFAIVLALSLASGFVYRGIAATREPAEPQRALATLVDAHDVRRVACTRVTWCDLAIGLGLRVLADDRIDAMPPRVRNAQLALARAKASWSREADAERIDAIVVGSRAPFATLLAAAGWHRVAPARDVAVYVRPGRAP